MGAYQMIQGIGLIVGFSLMGWVYEAISREAPIVLCSFALMAATLIIALFVEETHVVHPEHKALAPEDSAIAEAEPASK